MKWVLAFGVLAGAALLAHAEPYWIAYEGNDFPENEGWTRISSEPLAERWLQDGSLFVDSRAVGLTVDVYANSPPADPGPGELFVMAWRLLIHDSPLLSVGVNYTSIDGHAVAFDFDDHRLWYGPDDWVEFEPAVFHEYELRSADLQSYELRIDGIPSLEGTFHAGGYPPEIGFGDGTTKGSLAQWDYLRFGVVPEPAAGVLLCLLLLTRRVMR